MLDPRLEAAAREFGTRLAQTRPLRELHEAQEHLAADEGAQRLLAEWDQKQQELLDRQRTGRPITQAEIEDLRQLRAQVQNHPAVQAYQDREQQVQLYLADLLAVISEELEVDFMALSQAAEP